MSAARHLHPDEFKGYRPAKEEGKAASDWLSTSKGHEWQSKKFGKPLSESNTRASLGMFSVKEDSVSSLSHAASRWNPSRSWDNPHYG